MSIQAKRANLLTLIFLIIVTACTQAPTPVIQVPTLAVLPSVTVTYTPSPTKIPTATNTPLPTDTPTPIPSATLTPSIAPTLTLTPSLTFTATYTFTPTETFTPTFTPTDTFTPSLTPTSTFTATFTDTPTPTLTPTFPATDTPVPTPTVAGPQIFSFTVNASTVVPNTSITLMWAADADTAHLEALNQQNAVVQSFPVVPTGQYTLVVPSNFGRVVYYRLVATRNGIDDSRTIPITINCQFNWFFGNQYAPPGSGCPASGLTSDGRYQSFERGIMLYLNGNGLNRVYGLQNDSSLYIAYVNGWNGSTLNSSPAPSGRFIPQEMFNWAYYNTLAPIGSWNNALGWATAAIVNQPRTIQWENNVGGSNPFYIDAPDGAVYRFSGGDSGTWGRIK